MGEWRDIESAPKDGTEIIVSGWIFDDPTGGERWVTMAYWNDVEWFQSSDVGLYPPTHWQPFPSPPSN